ncbi:uncharacterized protein LOC120295926 [Eucalyptus grandis]|uniref:uncharacterized protein LOC120295926 n=1 Tax=Eucalyptus grandis TaxID=71139 RepID=UPI00192EA05A|nr:uncharacterized protein LOC120295926 [Eucalyptus grandis]
MQQKKLVQYQLGASKAPGPDGLNGLFYQQHWNIIKTTIIKTVQDFFTTGIPLSKLPNQAIDLHGGGRVSEAILNTPLNPSLLHDQLVWTATSSACKNAIATKDNLYQRHISPNPYCTLCNHNIPETIEHLFFFCPWTQDIWNHEEIRVTISPTSIRRFDAWVANRASLPRASPDFEVIANVLWEIWRQRNNAVFRQHQLDPLQAVDNALAQSRIIKLLHPSVQRINNNLVSSDRRWKPPEKGCLKCNVDGAFRTGSEDGSIACIYRDSK